MVPIKAPQQSFGFAAEQSPVLEDLSVREGACHYTFVITKGSVAPHRHPCCSYYSAIKSHPVVLRKYKRLHAAQRAILDIAEQENALELVGHVALS